MMSPSNPESLLCSAKKYGKGAAGDDGDDDAAIPQPPHAPAACAAESPGSPKLSLAAQKFFIR